MKVKGFTAGATISDTFYFMVDNTNILCKMNTNTGEVAVVNRYSEERINSLDSMLAIDDELIMISLDGKYIEIFNVLTNEDRILQTGLEADAWENYSGSYVHDDRIVLFPKKKRRIVCCDKKSGEVWHNDVVINSELISNQDVILDSCKIGNNLIFITSDTNSVFLLDLVSDKLHVIFQNEEVPYKSLSTDGENVFLLDILGRLWEFNMTLKKIKMLCDDLERTTKATDFYRIVYVNKSIWIFPSLGEQIYFYSLHNGTMNLYTEYPEGYEYIKDDRVSKFYRYYEDNEKIYMMMRKSNYMMVIEREKGQVEWMNPHSSDSSAWIQTIIQQEENVMEDVVSLGEFIEYLDSV